MHRVLSGRHDLLPLAAANPLRYPALLESVADGTAQARYDILFAASGEVLTLAADSSVSSDGAKLVDGSFLDALDAVWTAAHERQSPDEALPFSGGWFLYLGYELAGRIEPRLQLAAAEDQPVALAIRTPAAIIVDRRLGQTHLVAEPGFESLLDAFDVDLGAAVAVADAPLHVESVDEDDPQHFLAAVERVRAYLHAGDVFQVNLSREWRIRVDRECSPAGIHTALRSANPSPFAGLLQWQDFAIASSSPERLVQVRGSRVQTRPIAGTRPRFAEEDSGARIAELIGHPKERAEHIMLIDLMRNDLGRICRPGSIEVDQMMGIESYAHVHHIVSNVHGCLRDGTTPGQVIRALFPGGTITGCPKVRCMEIIAELEHGARGAYTGSFGYLDRSGNLDLNILIRTMTIRGRDVRFRAGAGIVVDSDAGAELAETRAKARGLLRAFGVSG